MAGAAGPPHSDWRTRQAESSAAIAQEAQGEEPGHEPGAAALPNHQDEGNDSSDGSDDSNN
ncbi:hypothetical protein C2U69_33640 [Cupriavidus pinatubonensis]|nr:hypothetical protein C2U69_33640 [Cupriavidus pinatubonensis]